MEGSKPWSTTIALGQTILAELNLVRDTDTMSRWLAHYLAEKIECASSAPPGAAGEAIRKECVDLVLRLWDRHGKSPLAIPLEKAVQGLSELMQPKPKYFNSVDHTDEPFIDLFHELADLHHRETQICLAVWIANLDLSKERTLLIDHPEHLGEEESLLTQNLIDYQDSLKGDAACVGDKPSPNFGSLPEAERVKLARAYLRETAKSRTALIRK